MELLSAAFAGLIQGVTEFLPVSSSGHLALLHAIGGFTTADDVAFDVALHLATVVPLVWYFRRELSRCAVGWLRSWAGRPSADGRLAWLLVAGTVPAVVAGLLGGAVIEERFRQPVVVATALGVVGLLMLAVEYLARPRRALTELRSSDAVAVGLAQALALMPGVSRSGITIIAGLALGLQRTTAARFSFLLAVPVVVGAAVFKLTSWPGVTPTGALPLVVAFAVAVVSGWWAIGFLLRWLQRATLKPFAYYRMALSLAVLAWWLMSE